MRVIISAGGTGGHIFPAIAIINKMKEIDPKTEFTYIGTLDRMEATLIPKLGIPYVGIEMHGLNRKKPFANGKVIKNFLDAIKKVEETIDSFKPDIVLGIGGYITAPVIYAAHKKKIKTFIHEQNSIPGLSNKFLSRYADKIGVSLPKSASYFDPKKTVYTGNPRSEEVLKIKATDKKEYGLSNTKKLVIIVMGSLGSQTMNEKLMDLVLGFEKKPYEVLLITGKDYYEAYKEKKVPSNVFLVPFIENLLGIMKQADLIVSRAGASTIAEITALGLPSILVPSPYVSHNHQMKNAKELEEMGATVIIEEKNFSKDTLLKEIDTILGNKEVHVKLKVNTAKLGVVDSATRICNEIYGLVGEKSHE